MPLVNKQAVSAAFSRAVGSYSYHDMLQRRSAHELRALLGRNNFITVLDAGCGPGDSSYIWQASGSQVTALDLSLKMVAQARKRQAAGTYLVADIEALPLSDAIFDLVWSNLAVQWCTSLGQALKELYRVTRPGGVVAFTTLLDRSLLELRQALRAVDMYTHTNRFLSQTEMTIVLSSWRYRYAVQSVTLRFDNALAAMRSLKGIGATYLHERQSKKVLTRGKLQRLELVWPQRQGQFPLTYQLFHGVIERD